MKQFSGLIDMSRLPGCRTKQVRVRRTGEGSFWCTAVLPAEAERDLGPVVLGFDHRLTDRWQQDAKDFIGGHVEPFLQALAGLLRQRGVIR